MITQIDFEERPTNVAGAVIFVLSLCNEDLVVAGNRIRISFFLVLVQSCVRRRVYNYGGYGGVMVLFDL